MEAIGRLRCHELVVKAIAEKMGNVIHVCVWLLMNQMHSWILSVPFPVPFHVSVKTLHQFQYIAALDKLDTKEIIL